MNQIQLIKYRFARSVNIIGWRLVSRISIAMIVVNDWCIEKKPQQEEVAE
jgi:hypothetical protein